MTDAWELVRAERLALIDDLAALDAEQWDLPSLCPGWTVHDVAAHLVDNAKVTRFGIVVAMARARFDFDRQNQQGVERERGATPAQTLDRLRAVADRRTGPPAPLDSRLVEEIVHGEDIRRPLGCVRDYPAEAVERALRYQVKTSVSVGGSKQRVAELALRANDSGIAIGDGPEVSGSGAALLVAVAGRAAALDALTGAGVDTLRARLR